MEQIIIGLNKEKEIITAELCAMTDFNYSSVQAKSKFLNERLVVLDKKLDEIKTSLLATNLP